MNKAQRLIDDEELLARYYSTDSRYPCRCYTKGTYWCSECKALVDAAFERQDIRKHLKDVLDEVIVTPCDHGDEWCDAVTFTVSGWESFYAKIMEAV